MSRPPFETAHLDDLDRFSGEFDTIPVRIPFGISAFGVNAYAAREAGGQIIEEHDELGAGAGRHEELYVVLTGPGDVHRGRDGARRSDRDAGLRPRPGHPPGRRRRRAGDSCPRRRRDRRQGVRAVAVGVVARGAALLRREGLRARRRHPVELRSRRTRTILNVLYNLACCEALAGRRDEAVAHITRAMELDPRTRDWAAGDSDLDSIRDAL